VLGATVQAWAHGPQIQLTIDNNKLVQRQLIGDIPYGGSLTPLTSDYVMPAKSFNNGPGGAAVWYTRPNGELNALGQPVYFSGPGIAFGYDQAGGGPEAFTVGSRVSIGFTSGLQKWNGSELVDAGDTQLEVFRGSGATLQTARTVDRHHRGADRPLDAGGAERARGGALERLAERSTSYVINEYLASPVPEGVQNINKLLATSRTISVFEGAHSRSMAFENEHCHSAGWFSPLNIQKGWVLKFIERDLQLEAHLGSANYLYVDAHVATLPEAQIHEWVAAEVNFALPE
jgi:prepilin-type processing-associated H-X9-DG protein